MSIQLVQIRGGGTTYSTPAGLAIGYKQYIAAEGPSNTLYWYFEDPNTVRLDGPLQIGGTGSIWSAPSLLMDFSNNFDIAVQGANNALYEYFVIKGVVHGPLGIGAPGSTYSSASKPLDRQAGGRAARPPALLCAPTLLRIRWDLIPR